MNEYNKLVGDFEDKFCVKMKERHKEVSSFFQMPIFKVLVILVVVNVFELCQAITVPVSRELLSTFQVIFYKFVTRLSYGLAFY